MERTEYYEGMETARMALYNAGQHRKDGYRTLMKEKLKEANSILTMLINDELNDSPEEVITNHEQLEPINRECWPIPCHAEMQKFAEKEVS